MAQDAADEYLHSQSQSDIPTNCKRIPDEVQVDDLYDTRIALEARQRERRRTLGEVSAPYNSGSLRPSSSMLSLRGSRQDGWELSTTKRNFRFSQEGFDLARSQPIVHKSSLAIGIEGERDFSPEKREAYRPFPPRIISSARPNGRYRPSSVTTGMAVEGPFPSRTEFKDHYDRYLTKRGSTSPQSTGSTTSERSNTSSWGEEMTDHSRISVRHRQRPPDSRFSSGSTTRSTYQDLSQFVESARPPPILPVENLRMEGEFSGVVSSRTHYGYPTYSRSIPCPRQQMIEPMRGKLNSKTTYREHIDDKAQYENLQRSLRYDYGLRVPDKIDWL